MIAPRLAAISVLLAACGGKPCPSSTMPASHDADNLHRRPDAEPLPALHAIDLSLAIDPAVAGQVSLRITSFGHEQVQIAIPARADQIELVDPRVALLPPSSPRVVWTAWRADNDALAGGSRAADALDKRVELKRGIAVELVVDLGRALGPEQFAHGGCARAWLIGGVTPVPSNVVCWPPA